MKQNYLTLFIFCLLLLGISSCQKEDKEIPDSPSSSTEIQLRSSNPFFQADFVSNTLGFNPRRDGFFEELEAMKASLALTFDNNAFLSGLPTENLYPCWDCAEPEYLGFANFYVPVYDIQANELKAIIIGQLKNQQYYFYYLNREVITQLKRTTIDGYISYWDGIFNYFDLPLDYSDRGDAFVSTEIPCINSTMNNICKCDIPSEFGQIYCGDDGDTPDCSGLFCSIPGDGGGEGPPMDDDGPIPFSDIFNWVRTWNNSGPGDTGGGGGGSSSQGSNNSSETPPPWGGYGDLFDGSLPEDSGSNVVDEENGIITIMNPRDLYELQVENFINQYGLTPTVEEILALVPEACAVSTVSEVHNCIKYHLINQTLEQYSLTNLSDEDKWFIFNNFEIYQDLVNILVENGGDGNPNGELSIAYVKHVLESRDVWSDVGLDILNPFEEFANNLAILESETTPSQTEIQNGIEIFESYLPPNPQTPNGDPFGGSDVNPNGGPDLEPHTDGDLSILTPNNQVKASLPVDIQEVKLEWLFYMATFFDAAGKIVADDYLAEFHENEAVFDYFHETLSEMVMNSTQMRDWLKNYGEALNQQLIATGGDIDEVIPPTGVSRPSLNESHALTILINDTQVTNVYRLDSYNFDPQTGKWDCFFLVNVIDHFGLDDGDVIDYQDHFPGGNGFIAWWALQHRYGWAPFRTDIWFVVHLGGKI